jgi:hypothetical protein
MLIFDEFANRAQAEGFATDVRDRLNLGATVYESQDQSDLVDPFPFELRAPIVLVDRSDRGKEEEAIDCVVEFGGRFAGT